MPKQKQESYSFTAIPQVKERRPYPRVSITISSKGEHRFYINAALTSQANAVNAQYCAILVDAVKKAFLLQFVVDPAKYPGRVSKIISNPQSKTRIVSHTMKSLKVQPGFYAATQNDNGDWIIKYQ